jgi:hypothetical protein
MCKLMRLTNINQDGQYLNFRSRRPVHLFEHSCWCRRRAVRWDPPDAPARRSEMRTAQRQIGWRGETSSCSVIASNQGTEC